MAQDEESRETIFDETEVEYIADGSLKKVKVAEINYAEEYDKRNRICTTRIYCFCLDIYFVASERRVSRSGS